MRSSQLTAQRRQIELERRAFGHRARPTASEARLWEALRARRLGVQFRRQVPVCGRYIADFCAPAVKLVIEVDGGGHAARRSADARRDRMLAAHGYRTLRLPALLVTESLEQALEVVRQALRA